MDYEVQRCSRKCATTGRDLAEGEVFYSALFQAGQATERRDYAREAWTGPPEGAVAWWKSRMPTRDDHRAKLAPDEVLLDYFRELAGHPDQADLRFVLALLLVRRRILRMEEDAEEGRPMRLYCPRDAETYEVVVAQPDARREAEIQEALARLLYADAA
ncbi:MAG: hypothetical protein K1X74_22370 [Pirellulales bacterium]|nr:hypothetical protein [Pirellulales bacterium]